MNPFTVLGVAPSATDREVRDAYLAGIRQFPPDTAPDRFRAISEAYGKIKDEESRLNDFLFGRDRPGDTPLDVVINHQRLAGPPRPLPIHEMRALLRESVKSASS
ncbi:hypothetical protein BH23VER1_BH23VER1_05500 [soil metagenome]